MGLKQYKVGKSFEEELCWWFRENGYYPEYHEKSISGSQNRRYYSNKKKYCI